LFFSLPLPGHVPVLMYHFIGNSQEAKDSKNYVTRESFARQMAFLKRFGYHPISMRRYFDFLSKKRKPSGQKILITIDDGHYTFESDALPVLSQYEFPVTLFVISGNIQKKIGGSMDQATIEKLLKTSWINIQAHTQTHSILTDVSDEQLERETAGAKKDL